MISLFANHLRYVKQYSLRTVESYRDVLVKWSSFLDSCNVSLFDASIHELREFVCAEMSRGLSARSVNQNVSAINTFYKWMRLYQDCKVNPCESWQPIKSAKRLPLFINIDKLSWLLDCALPKQTWQQKRAWFSVLLLFSTGVRATEAVNIRVSDIDFSNRFLRVIGKGNKERLIPFGDELNSEMKRYITENRRIQDSFLLTTKDGMQLESWQLREILMTSMSKFLPREFCHPHVLRHSFATALINNGASLEAIQHLLGHSSVRTTQVYTHVAFKPLQSVYNQCFAR